MTATDLDFAICVGKYNTRGKHQRKCRLCVRYQTYRDLIDNNRLYKRCFVPPRLDMQTEDCKWYVEPKREKAI